MPLRDVVYLIVKPFLGQKQGPTKNEVLSRAVEHGAIKDARRSDPPLGRGALRGDAGVARRASADPGGSGGVGARPRP